MLIGLNLTDEYGTETKGKLSEKIANSLSGNVHIFEPKTFEDYILVLRGYKAGSPKNHLILVKTHYKFEEKSSNGRWRAADINFALKGGVVFGIDPGRETVTYEGKILADPSKMALVAQWTDNRTSQLKKDAKGYFGRTSLDPHTLVLGFTPTYPGLSNIAESLLDGLSDEWWKGVGFFNRRFFAGKSPEEHYKTALDRFEYASLVTVTDSAHQVLTSLGYEHQNASQIYLRTFEDGVLYGRKIRELAHLDSLRVV